MFEQERVLVRLQQYVLRQDDVLVCFLAGSFGRAEEDPFSDLDVTLIYKDAASRSQAYQQRRAMVRDVMPYVPARSFDADHVRPYLHVALYGNGAKVDFTFETAEALESGQTLRHIRLLKDTARLGERFAQTAASSSHRDARPTITTEQLTQLDNRFWVMFMDVFRLLLRGDADKPFPIYLQLLYFTLPTLISLLPSGAQARQRLLDVRFEQDVAVNGAAMKRLLAAYLEARSEVVRLHHLGFSPDAAFESGIKRLVDAA